MNRHRGRAYTMQQWIADAQKQERERRKRTRLKNEQRMQKLQTRFEAIEAEKELERRTCSLCQRVRAEAWGLGHVTWKERECSKCWASHAELRSRLRLAAAAAVARPLGRSASDGEAGGCPDSSSSSREERERRAAHLPPWQAGRAAALGRRAEGLALLGVPVTPGQPPFPGPLRVRGDSSRLQGLSHSFSYAPAWGAPEGRVQMDPWEGQQQRLLELHDLRNELLLEQARGASLHPASRSVRVLPRPGSVHKGARMPSPWALGEPPAAAGRSHAGRAAAEGEAVQEGSVRACSSGSDSDSSDGNGSGRSASRQQGGAAYLQGRVSEQGDSSEGGRGGRRAGGCAEGMDRGVLCEAVRRCDAETLLHMLGPSVLEKLLEGCLVPAQDTAACPPRSASEPHPHCGSPTESLAEGPSTVAGGSRSASTPAKSAPSGQQQQPQQAQPQQAGGTEAATPPAAALLESLSVAMGTEPHPPLQPQLQLRQQQCLMGWPQTQQAPQFRRHPQYQHQHRHRHHAANQAQLQWAGSLRMPGLSSSHGPRCLPGMEAQALRAAVRTQRQRREEGGAASEGAAGGEGVDLPVEGGERKRREQDVQQEERMRAQLAQAEQDLVMAPTQGARTAALFLACTLREELGRLARHNRCYKRMLETRKHAARASPRDLVYGIKRVAGRYEPPETALPIGYDRCGHPRYSLHLARTHVGALRASRAAAGAVAEQHPPGLGTADGRFPDNGIMGATGLRPAPRAPAHGSSRQHAPRIGDAGKRVDVRRCTSSSVGSGGGDCSSSEDYAAQAQAVPGCSSSPPTPTERPALAVGSSRPWGPGHPHTSHARPHRHLRQPHLIQDACYAAALPQHHPLHLSPDPNIHPVQSLGRICSGFDPHHNLTHYQLYAHRHYHCTQPPAPPPQPLPRKDLGTKYPGADAFSSEGPLYKQLRYKSRADAAAEAAVARIRDPFGYGTPSLLRDLAWADTHPATADPLRVADQVPWKPQAARLSPSSPGGWDDADPQQAWTALFTGGSQGSVLGASVCRDQAWVEQVAAWLCKSQRERVQEAKQLRSMPVDDYKQQLRKEREWQRALREVHHLLWAKNELEDIAGCESRLQSKGKQKN